MKASEMQTQFDAQWNRKVDDFPGVVFDPADDRTRQEFKDDCDVNTILARHMGVPLDQRPVEYGEYDFELTLRDGLEAVRASEKAWDSVPKNLREKYKDWSSLVAAVESGEVVFTRGVGDAPAPKEPGKEPVAPAKGAAA